MSADLGVPLSDLRPLCVSVAGGEVRCFIDAIFGHSLGSGVSTRAGRGPSSPPLLGGVRVSPSSNPGRFAKRHPNSRRENVNVTMKLHSGSALLLAVIMQLIAYTLAETQCDKGTEPSSSATSCVECEQGKYKASAGTEACLACPQNTFSSSERAEDLEGATVSMKAVTSIPGNAVAVSVALSPWHSCHDLYDAKICCTFSCLASISIAPNRGFHRGGSRGQQELPLATTEQQMQLTERLLSYTAVPDPQTGRVSCSGKRRIVCT